MSQYWESPADRSDRQYTSDELELTAYRLVVEQVLYYADRHSRTAFWMIEAYEREFRRGPSTTRYRRSGEPPVTLCLRGAQARQGRCRRRSRNGLCAGTARIYDEAASTGQLTDDGEVVCDLVELAEKYQADVRQGPAFQGKSRCPDGNHEALGHRQEIRRFGLR